MGYHRAGFEVVGVDIAAQKKYPFEFYQADALTFPLEGFDLIHASPPCQAHTALKSMHNAKEHPDLIPATRARLIASGVPYIIENVPGATLARGSVMLCGTMFGLGTGDAELRRHRWFESSHCLFVPECNHGGRVIGVYGSHGRDRRRSKPVTIGVYGGGHGASLHRAEKGQKCFTAEQEREAMGIGWMGVNALSQAIPPAYTEFLGRQVMAILKNSLTLSATQRNTSATSQAACRVIPSPRQQI